MTNITKELKVLKTFTSKDETRLALHHIIQSAKHKELVATDGHSMLIIKNENDLDSDVWYNKNFDVVDLGLNVNYPDYKRMETEMVRNYNHEATIISIRVFNDGSHKNNFVELTFDNGLAQVFNYKLLKSRLKLVKNAKIYVENDKDAVSNPIRLDWGNKRMFVMPMRSDGYGETLAKFDNIKDFINTKI